MTGDFKAFLERFFSSIGRGDSDFLRGVYLDWFESSGAMPDREFGEFLDAAMPDLRDMLGSSLAGEECFGDFCIAHMKGADGSAFSLAFRRKGSSFVFFNERSGFASFRKAYALNYALDGGRLRVLFNGKRSPIIYEIGSTGFVTLINSALKPGANEMTLEPAVAGAKVKASIRISSGTEGDIMDSAQGDALSYDGVVGGPVTLKFLAE
jgi:hypothetical protein